MRCGQNRKGSHLPNQYCPRKHDLPVMVHLRGEGEEKGLKEVREWKGKESRKEEESREQRGGGKEGKEGERRRGK